MGITCILILIIIVLIAVIIGYKREFRRISKQINNNLDEYANIKTKSVDKDIEYLVENINLIFDSKQRIVAEKNKNEEELRASIANMSHDLRTPLTSIINYVDLLKKEDIRNEKANEYIEILDSKSQRLKKLIEDLVEASKVSTGNVKLQIEKINIVELLNQAIGEFEDKFEAKKLEILLEAKESEIYILADSRYMYRIVENLFSNISKYALENSRVYIDIIKKSNEVYIEMKNISKEKLNISAEELMQRFVIGDKSRTTEGSGLGISIAQNLTEIQKGVFNLKLDGDLFRVELIFNIL